MSSLIFYLVCLGKWVCICAEKVETIASRSECVYSFKYALNLLPCNRTAKHFLGFSLGASVIVQKILKCCFYQMGNCTSIYSKCEALRRLCVVPYQGCIIWYYLPTSIEPPHWASRDPSLAHRLLNQNELSFATEPFAAQDFYVASGAQC